MTNMSIKQRGHEVVIKYEKARGRKATIIEADGYDILSKGRGGCRYIEAKSTSNARPHFRTLTKPQARQAFGNRQWFLYVVCNVRKGTKQTVVEFTAKDIAARLKKTIVYQIDFRSSDFRDGKLAKS